MQPYAPADTDFTVPYMMGGPRPKPTGAPGQAQPTTPATAGVELPPLPASGPPAPPTATAAPTTAADAAAPTTGAAPKPWRKPIKIDPCS